MNSKKRTKVVFTGGGTAGHVTPNIAIMEILAEQGIELDYIGSQTGIEKNMIQQLKIPYHAIDSGKLRRHWSFKHFTEPFHVLNGIVQAFFLLGRLKPNVVFSKGGFVSFPVVLAAWIRHIPVIVHESDMSPGLANRMAFPFAKKICVNFPSTLKYFKDKSRVMVTGTPVRKGLLCGDKDKGFEYSGLQRDIPIIMLIGGSLGAQKLNYTIREILPSLLGKYQVIHICGRNNVDKALLQTQGYRQYEFVNQELGDLFAISDMVISRSGANALYELLTLAKPHLLIPLSTKASRGDQIENAAYFAQLGVSEVLAEEKLEAKRLLECIDHLMQHKEEYHAKIKGLGFSSATDKVKSLIDTFLGELDAQKKWVID